MNRPVIFCFPITLFWQKRLEEYLFETPSLFLLPWSGTHVYCEQYYKNFQTSTCSSTPQVLRSDFMSCLFLRTCRALCSTKSGFLTTWWTAARSRRSFWSASLYCRWGSSARWSLIFLRCGLLLFLSPCFPFFVSAEIYRHLSETPANIFFVFSTTFSNSLQDLTQNTTNCSEILQK